MHKHITHLLTLFLFIVSTHQLVAQIESERTRNILNRPQAFYIEALNFAQIDSFGMHNRLDVYVKIPYDIIQFVKTENAFTARYTLTIIFSDENGNRIKEESFEQKLIQQDFDATVAQNMYDLTQKSFILPTGKVVLEVIFEDAESNKDYRQSKSIEIKKYDKNLFSMSDLMIVSKASEAGGKKMITPHVMPNIAALTNGFFLFFEVYNPFVDQNVRLYYEVKSSKNTLVHSQHEDQKLQQGRNSFISKIKQAFDVGSYSITASLYRSEDTAQQKVLTGASTAFIEEWLSSGAPISINDLDAAIEQLKYFARGEDIDYMKEAKEPKEKRRRFEDFWEKQNPVPGSKTNTKMIEYYNRVAYANAHFKHYIDGWKTERGMVYIINGAPSYVDRHPFEVETKPYEIWEYYDLNKRYIFVDESGFGDYRLLYPMWDERNRIR